MEYALALGTPCAIRYPRGTAFRESMGLEAAEAGRCRVLKPGENTWILSAGKCREAALQAAGILEDDGLPCGVIDARFIKPLDEEGILKNCGEADLIVTLEDNSVRGGFGSMVEDLFAGRENRPKIIVMGWPDAFVQSGKTARLEEIYGLDGPSVAERIRKER